MIRDTFDIHYIASTSDGPCVAQLCVLLLLLHPHSSDDVTTRTGTHRGQLDFELRWYLLVLVNSFSGMAHSRLLLIPAAGIM